MESYDYSEEASNYESSDDEDDDDENESFSNNSSDLIKKNKNIKKENKIIHTNTEDININDYIKENDEMKTLREENAGHLSEIRDLKIKSAGNKNIKKKELGKYNKIISYNP